MERQELENNLQKLTDYNEKMQDVDKHLMHAITQCKENIAILGSKSFYDKVGDFFFYGNEERFSLYKNSVHDLINLFEKCKTLAYENHTALGCVESLILTFIELKRLFNSIIPYLELRIALPKLVPNSPESFVVVILGAVVSILLFFCQQAISKLEGEEKFAALAALTAVMLLVDGVIRGYERKEIFEEGKIAFDEKSAALQEELLKPLSKLSTSLNKWFERLVEKLKEAGIENVSVSNKPGIVHAVQEYVKNVQEFVNSCNYVRNLVNNSAYNVDEAIRVLEIKSELHKFVKLWYYYTESDMPIEDIANLVGLSESERRDYTALVMLKESKPAQEIAEATDKSVGIIENMGKQLKLIKKE